MPQRWSYSLPARRNHQNATHSDSSGLIPGTPQIEHAVRVVWQSSTPQSGLTARLATKVVLRTTCHNSGLTDMKPQCGQRVCLTWLSLHNRCVRSSQAHTATPDGLCGQLVPSAGLTGLRAPWGSRNNLTKCAATAVCAKAHSKSRQRHDCSMLHS
jgi:hypothetical protein